MPTQRRCGAVTMALRGSDKPCPGTEIFVMAPSGEIGGYVAKVEIYTICIHRN